MAKQREKTTMATLLAKKRAGLKISVLTSYDYPTAVIAEESGIDCLLVGDSLGQAMLGHENTLPVTMDLMVTLSAAVRRGAPKVYLIGDMPYLSYHLTDQQAIENAGRFMAEGHCDCVKVECDRRLADRVRAMSAATIPVMAHLGLRPQAVHQAGGYRCQAKDYASAVELIEDARILADAGAVALLIEAVPPEPAAEIAARSSVPVIGCGAGPGVDGQVVVLYDMLGLLPTKPPKFVKQYASLRRIIGRAMRRYAQEVAEGAFPGPDQCYSMKEGEARKLVEQPPPA